MNIEFPDGLNIIRADKSHRGFIISTWVRSCWQTLRASDKLAYSTYIGNEPARAEAHYSSAHVLSTDGESIHGWVCGIPGVLHYVYVPLELRGSGVGRSLVLAICGERFEHARENQWLKKVFPKSKLNPFLLGLR